MNTMKAYSFFIFILLTSFTIHTSENHTGLELRLNSSLKIVQKNIAEKEIIFKYREYRGNEKNKTDKKYKENKKRKKSKITLPSLEYDINNDPKGIISSDINFLLDLQLRKDEFYYLLSRYTKAVSNDT